MSSSIFFFHLVGIAKPRTGSIAWSQYFSAQLWAKLAIIGLASVLADVEDVQLSGGRLAKSKPITERFGLPALESRCGCVRGKESA